MSSQHLPTNQVAHQPFVVRSGSAPQLRTAAEAQPSHAFESYVNEGIRSSDISPPTCPLSSLPSHSPSQPSQPHALLQPPIATSPKAHIRELSAAAVPSPLPHSKASTKTQPPAALSLAQVHPAATALCFRTTCSALDVLELDHDLRVSFCFEESCVGFLRLLSFVVMFLFVLLLLYCPISNAPHLAGSAAAEAAAAAATSFRLPCHRRPPERLLVTSRRCRRLGRLCPARHQHRVCQNVGV